MTTDNRPKRVVIAMSGGVDSSVAAALLKKQGYDVIGVTMQLWDKGNISHAGEEESRPCCTLEDLFDAGRVANKLDIPFHVVNYQAEFRKLVVDGFVDEYFCGRTPNPCIRCNQNLKFGVLLDKARSLGADYLATGHYARLEQDSSGMFQIHKGKDAGKDQSYFLFTLTQEQMSRVLFPLGSLTKQEVRRLAVEFELPVAKKGESQDICFVSNDDYVQFLESERGEGELSGNIVDSSGKILGRHEGIYRYTIGQRKGLGIAWPHPLYVLGVDAERREVLVGHRDELCSTGLSAGDVNWAINEPLSPLVALCKIRYRHNPVPSVITPLSSNRVEVRFQEPEKSVTPGQAVVFYDGDKVIGGGWIEHKL
ncbi:MAG: tRNA 2-thiouridine(34) synthase MnmA [Deltaproteobacteria bacterium]